jgi:hypothetical protein
LARKRKKKWIKGAIKRPGALRRKAKRAGKSISSYCAQGNLSTRTKRQCALAKTLGKLRKRKRKR